MRISIVTITFILLSCGQRPEASIEVGDVKSIEITINPSNDSSSTEIIRLSEEQIKEIIAGWNDATSEGLCKFWPHYLMTIYFTDGGIRKFRLTSHEIKESDDECYKLEDGLVERIIVSSKASVQQQL